jgi:hypothetical protein
MKCESLAKATGHTEVWVFRRYLVASRIYVATLRDLGLVISRWLDVQTNFSVRMHYFALSMNEVLVLNSNNQC